MCVEQQLLCSSLCQKSHHSPITREKCAYKLADTCTHLHNTVYFAYTLFAPNSINKSLVDTYISLGVSKTKVVSLPSNRYFQSKRITRKYMRKTKRAQAVRPKTLKKDRKSRQYTWGVKNKKETDFSKWIPAPLVLTHSSRLSSSSSSFSSFYFWAANLELWSAKSYPPKVFFVFGATRYPEHRAQNSLFASLISFLKAHRPPVSWWMDRSVTAGEHENIRNTQTRRESLCACHFPAFWCGFCCQLRNNVSLLTLPAEAER